MSERKVINKYYPPNFDPAAIPRRKMPKDAQYKVRLMTPFSMRCETCGEYVYKGKKFNARKEVVEGEMYHAIRIFRFYIRCPRCSAEITFKTDPKNTDYVAEHGAVRNFEPWREERITGEEEKKAKEEEEENNPMKALENRTEDSKREMEILDALDEIRTRNARNERVDADDILDKLTEEDKTVVWSQLSREEEEDEELARSIFHTTDGESVKRLMEDDEPDPIELISSSAAAVSLPAFSAPVQTKKRKDNAFSSLGVLVKKKKPDDQVVASRNAGTSDCPAKAKPVSALAALGSYDSDSDGSE
ncbi:hypothetical protein BC936DRAFT_145116 [Jimgerdemannia flammicorona]|uniref:Splicing factor YJU2 n=1 Tax=Jimgerdemannia flammicorona TaxID=994334 RepID=A0A433DAW1_9FUNG|nr:hypothetical protein BC936DRAFT_145116 [Jimgerdemannia flammicorona]